MEKEDKRFIKYPNEGEQLTPNEALVYVTLRSYMNSITMECFPSIDTVCKDSDLSRGTVSGCIKKLVEKRYITRRKDGNKMVYKFNEENKFEPFSYNFLKKDDLTPTEKGVLILCQKYMFKDVGYGVLRYSDRKLEELIDVSKSTLNRVFKSLEKKNYLVMGNLPGKNGDLVKVKQINLTKLEQAIVFTLLEHGKDIDELKQRADKSDELIDILLKKVEALEKQEKLRQRLEESSRLAEEELYMIRHGE